MPDGNAKSAKNVKSAKLRLNGGASDLRFGYDERVWAVAIYMHDDLFGVQSAQADWVGDGG